MTLTWRQYRDETIKTRTAEMQRGIDRAEAEQAEAEAARLASRASSYQQSQPD